MGRFGLLNSCAPAARFSDRRIGRPL